MGTLLSYSLAVSVIILLLFPILHQVVNRSTRFRYNRVVLMCGIALSLALPFAMSMNPFTFALTEPSATVVTPLTADMPVSVTATSADNVTTPAHGTDWIAIAVIIYCMGIILLVCREIFSFIRLYSMIVRSGKTKRDGFTICRITDSDTAPFSWGNYIFLHDAECENSNDSIYLHEKAHTARRHWVDVLLTDLFCIMVWYNPFAWMTRQLVRLNHEFEADSEVIGSGVDTRDYQHLLVIKAMGTRVIPVTNSFAAGKRSFRKRVLIMSRQRSKRKTMFIALFALPAAFLGCMAIASPLPARLLSVVADYRFEKAEDTSIGEAVAKKPEAKVMQATVYSILDQESSDKDKENGGGTESSAAVTKLPSPLRDQSGLQKILRLSLATIETDKTTKVNIGIVVDENGRVKEVVTDGADNEVVKAVVDQALNGIEFERMTENGMPIQMRYTIPVTIRPNN